MSTTSISCSSEQELSLIMLVPQAPSMQQQHSLVRIPNRGKWSISGTNLSPFFTFCQDS